MKVKFTQKKHARGIAALAMAATLLVLGTLSGCQSSSEESSSAEESSGSSVTTIYAATTASPRPFTYYNDDDELTGQNIELVEAIFEKLPQYELEWVVTDDVFAGLDSDKYQLGVNNYAMNDERKEKYLFSDPIYKNSTIVIAREGIELGDEVTFEDLVGYTYVGTAGVNHTTYVEEYNEENPDNQIEIIYTEEGTTVTLSGIQDGKYDFTIVDAPMFYGYYQEEFELDNVNSAYLTSTDLLYSYLIVSQGNEELLEDINEALREVIEEGTSKEINEKYFGEDYSPSYDDD